MGTHRDHRVGDQGYRVTRLGLDCGPYEAARASAARVVAAILFGWAAAQRDYVLPGLTLSAASAANSTLLAVIISVAVGAVILSLSRALLVCAARINTVAVAASHIASTTMGGRCW